MKTALPTLLQIAGALSVLGFVVGFAAHLQLQFCIDHDRVKRESGEPGWKVLGSVLAPADYYIPTARWVWRVRNAGLKSFAVCVGVAILIVVVAAAVGVPLT